MIAWTKESAHNHRAHRDGQPLQIIVRCYGEATGTTLWEVVDTRRSPWVLLNPAISTERSAKMIAETWIGRSKA